jgi:hypothetical protein
MISWNGQTVSLTGSTELIGYSTITWSADPVAGASITGGDTLTPNVTLTPTIAGGPFASIANASFEDELSGWAAIGAGGGNWNGRYGGITYITPTDGGMCAYVDGYATEGGLAQTLVETLAANTTYTLTVDVVNDGYYEEDVEYKVQLLAGGDVLAEDDNGHALNTYYLWETSTVTYNSGAAPAQLGEPLEIRLLAKVGTSEMNFDNVQLTANPPFPDRIPDVSPFTYTLKLDIDGKYATMTIDVYEDACQMARIGEGKAADNPGDVDGNCITDFKDVALMAILWLTDSKLTSPTPKP